MNIHEYQAKALFRDYAIAIPDSRVTTSVDQIRQITEELGGTGWVVKAQVHSGGRGKAGGVVLTDSVDQTQTEARRLLGSVLKTNQTGEAGLPVNKVLIEKPTEISRELYLGMLVDRAQSRVVFMLSSSGGMNIEDVAQDTPEKILNLHIDPAAGLQPYQCRRMGFFLGLEGDQIKQITTIAFALYRLFTEKDASLIEINPLVVTKTGDLLALDAKINFDSNALYRHPDIVQLRDISQEDPHEAEAAKHNLSYINLDGNIGCMVNGAGLAMATMDLVKLQGGNPANFLDVGGGTTAERVAEAFKLILSDQKVKAILVNIFGGIVRCNLIAEGIIEAAKAVELTIPVICRLEGTNAQQGLDMLNDSGLNIETASDLTTAAKRVVAVAGGAQ